MNRRLRLPLALLVSLALPGCGQPSGTTSPRRGDGDIQLVAFANAGAVPTIQAITGPAVVIESAEAARAFARLFAPGNPEVVTRLQDAMAAKPPGPDRVLLGFRGLGCAEDGARLQRHDDDLVAEFTGGRGTVCVAASQLVAVFSVARRALPATGRFAGLRP